MHTLIHAAAIAVVIAPLAATAAPPADVDMVALPVVPGLLVHVPKDWTACDAAMQARLSPPPGSEPAVAHVCMKTEGVTWTKLQLVDLRPGRQIEMVVMQGDKLPITPETLAVLSPEGLEKIRYAICDNGAKRSVAVLRCQVTLGVAGGHPALVNEIERADPDDSDHPLVTLAYGVPYAGHYNVLVFNFRAALRTAVQPEIDTVVAAVEIQ